MSNNSRDHVKFNLLWQSQQFRRQCVTGIVPAALTPVGTTDASAPKQEAREVSEVHRSVKTSCVNSVCLWQQPRPYSCPSSLPSPFSGSSTVSVPMYAPVSFVPERSKPDRGAHWTADSTSITAHPGSFPWAPPPSGRLPQTQQIHHSSDQEEMLETGLSSADLWKWILNFVPIRSSFILSSPGFLGFITWKLYKACNEEWERHDLWPSPYRIFNSAFCSMVYPLCEQSQYQ